MQIKSSSSASSSVRHAGEPVLGSSGSTFDVPIVIDGGGIIEWDTRLTEVSSGDDDAGDVEDEAAVPAAVPAASSAVLPASITDDLGGGGLGFGEGSLGSFFRRKRR